MAPPEANSNSSSRSDSVDDAAGVDELSLHEEGTAPEHDADPSTVATDDPDPWAASAGYTPLMDINDESADAHSGALFVAYDPNHETVLYTNDQQRVAFFSDPGAFVASCAVAQQNGEEEDDEQQQQDHSSEETATTDSNALFRLADQALRSLDDEYSLTLAGGTRSSSDAIAPAVVAATRHESVDHRDSAEIPSDTIAATPTSPLLTQKEQPPIDTNAVRRAVNSIRLKDPKLTTNMQLWQLQRKQQQKQPQHGDNDAINVSEPFLPSVHPIIPRAPLSAFSKVTPKAKKATANLSRSCTLAEALHRLIQSSHLVLNQRKQRNQLLIHIVGADGVECNSQEKLRAVFGPFVRWLSACAAKSVMSIQHVRLDLIGPNVPTHATEWKALDLLPQGKSNNEKPGALLSATAKCHVSNYHDWMAQSTTNSQPVKIDDGCVWQRPDFIMTFNSGIWGYDEWRPTLEALFMHLETPIPFVSTAYTLQEAQDDEEVMEEILAKCAAASLCIGTVMATAAKPTTVKDRRLWPAEPNPFASAQPRRTLTAVDGRDYRENGAWQAWNLGGVTD